MERTRSEMVGTAAWGYPNRKGAFGILFPDRDLHCHQHSSEPAVLDLSQVIGPTGFEFNGRV